MVAHNLLTALRSRSGGGAGPLAFSRPRDLFAASLLAPDCALSRLPVESLAAWALSRATEPRVLSDSDLREVSRLMSGRTSFFCLEGGRISSRSTGTPKETRKRRRMRDCVQLGGWRGGGVTSCFQRERERSEGKMGDVWETGGGGGRDERCSSVLEGKMRSRCCWVAASRSGREERASKSISGWSV